MEALFKTSDNKYINISDIISIEIIDNNANVYLQNSSDYLILTDYDYELLKEQIGFKKYCGAGFGFSETDDFINWPDSSKFYFINENTNWQLYEVFNDISIKEIELTNVKTISYNKITKMITFKLNSGEDYDISLSNGNFNLSTSETDVYKFNGIQRTRISAKDYTNYDNTLLVYQSSDDYSKFIDNDTYWTLKYKEGYEGKELNFSPLKNILYIEINFGEKYIEFMQNDENFTDTFVWFNEYIKDNNSEENIVSETIFVLSSKNPDESIEFTQDGLFVTTESSDILNDNAQSEINIETEN